MESMASIEPRESRSLRIASKLESNDRLSVSCEDLMLSNTMLSFTGPGIMSFSISDLSPTSASWAPSVPRSRSVVKPLSKFARAWTVALLMRYATGSFDT